MQPESLLVSYMTLVKVRGACGQRLALHRKGLPGSWLRGEAQQLSRCGQASAAFPSPLPVLGGAAHHSETP